jgi:S1-C subfamily serine protease
MSNQGQPEAQGPGRPEPGHPGHAQQYGAYGAYGYGGQDYGPASGPNDPTIAGSGYGGPTGPYGAGGAYMVPGGGYGGYPGAPGGPGGGYPGQPGGPGGGYGAPAPRRRRMMTAVLAAVIAFAGGAGITAWAVGVPGTSIGGALGNKTLSTASIVQKTDPAVVDIVSTLGGLGAQSAGTGIVLSSSGEVLTNNHVIDGATSIRVTDVGNGRTYSATVTGYDARHDIAVLRMSGASGLKTATLGDSATVGLGQKVVAIGNAGGRGGLPSVATGHVTGLGKSITAVDQGSGSSERLTGMIRTDANIQPGDSGGPLLNTQGQVIGINTAASTGATQAPAGGQQAFAIPITRAVTTAHQIDSGQASDTVHIGPTAFIGVQISSQAGPGGSSGGAPVAGVVPGAPAASAGIAAGDVITAIGGQAVTSPTSLRDHLIAHHPGDTVSVTWHDQSGQSHSAKVQLGTGPAA